MTVPPPILEPHRYTTFPAERDVLRWLLGQTAYLDLTYTAMVEIGAHEGKTSEFLAQHRDWRDFYVIDPWDGTQDSAGDEVYARFLTRMAPVLREPVAYGTTGLTAGRVIIWRQRSQDATPPPTLGFVFHDGDHRDLSDLSKWWDALVPGGILVVHDASEPGWPCVRVACEALGRPWHEYRYLPGDTDRTEYGPSTRGLFWKVKPR